MKAIAPVLRPQKDSSCTSSGSSGSSGSSSELSLHRLSEHSLHIARCRRMEEEEEEEEEQQQQEDLYHHQQHYQHHRRHPQQHLHRGVVASYGDMNDCYSRLKRLVPTIPRDKKVSRVEILQHVIDYILDLQLALETHPALSSSSSSSSKQPLQPQTSTPSRTPLTVLNIDHQRTSIVKKPEDSILCR